MDILFGIFKEHYKDLSDPYIIEPDGKIFFRWLVVDDNDFLTDFFED